MFKIEKKMSEELAVITERFLRWFMGERFWRHVWDESSKEVEQTSLWRWCAKRQRASCILLQYIFLLFWHYKHKSNERFIVQFIAASPTIENAFSRSKVPEKGPVWNVDVLKSPRISRSSLGHPDQIITSVGRPLKWKGADECSCIDPICFTVTYRGHESPGSSDL